MLEIIQHFQSRVVKFLACADTEQQDNASRSTAQCSSTLPYALSKWPEISETKFVHVEVGGNEPRRKLELDSSSSVEVRRKLSFLEEKRAIFQRRFFDSSSRDTRSYGATMDATIDDPSAASDKDLLKGNNERKTNVSTFDAFPGLEGVLLEPSDHLDDIEEDCTESYNRTDDNYSRFHAAMAVTVCEYDEPSRQDRLRINFVPEINFF